MSQTFTNIGPIYTTQAKYDALVQAGTVELGREYVIVDAHGEVYDVQINGTSILSNGVANIPIATVNDSGVIKVGASFNTSTLQSGYMQAVTNNYSTYQSKGNDAFVGKGTLENVLDNEGIRPDKAQSLTDEQKTQARTNIAAIAMEEYNPSATSYEEGVIYYTTEA